MPPYTVQLGDTLWDIAAKTLGNPFHWPDLARANRLSPTTPLLIGQPLYLPPARLSGPLAWQTAPPNAGFERTPATTIPARLYLFVLADEILPSEKVVRRVLVQNEHNAEFIRSAPDIAERLMKPDKFGLRAPVPDSPISIGRHVKGMNNSRYLSASRLMPLGAERIEGRPFWIDVARAEKAGVTIHETEEILNDIDRIIAKTRNPQKILEFQQIKEVVRADHEVLLEGEVPASAIKSATSMGLTRSLRIIQGVGLVLSAYDLEQAGVQSYRHNSIRPLAKEAVHQVGGWAGAFVGLKVGSAFGAALGIESGPGAILTGAIGGIAGGVAGYFGADWVEKKLF